MAPLNKNIFCSKYLEPIDEIQEIHQIQEIQEMQEIEEMQEVQEIQNERSITPPISPPSPPGPPEPPSPLWTQKDFNFYTNVIQSHLDKLENIVMGPHIIFINGIQHLRSNTGQNWKERFHRLLFECGIPFFWILNCMSDDDDDNDDNDYNDNDNDNNDNYDYDNDYDYNYDYENNEENEICPQRIRIYLISHDVKNKVLNMLNSYLRNKYNNIVYLE